MIELISAFFQILFEMSQEQTNREIHLLRNELETTLQIKNNQILELEHLLRKADMRNKHHEDKMIAYEAEIRVLKEKNKELELFARERSHAITHKNIKIAQLEEQIETLVAQRTQELQAKVEGLEKIIIWQEEEINQYLIDHQNYLHEFEKLQTPYRYMSAERQLLQAFNNELQSQIGDVETANIELEGWLVKSHEELAHQNEQSNDMLGQLEYMVQTAATGR